MTTLKIELNSELRDYYNADVDKQLLLRLNKLLTGIPADVDEIKLTHLCTLDNSVNVYTGASIISVRTITSKILGNYSTETSWEYYQQVCMRFTKLKDIPTEHYNAAKAAFKNLELGVINNEQALEVLIRAAISINHKGEDISKEEHITNEIKIGLLQRLNNLIPL